MNISRTTALSAWMIASIFYAYQYILRVMPNIMMDDIMQHFQINSAIFGQFSGVYYIGYALMHLPLGVMLDRYGPKKIMTVSVILTVVGLLPILGADNWIYAVIGRALIGIGSAAAIMGTFKIIRMTFSEQHFTRMLSLSVTIGLVGAIYGGGPVSYMCEMWGYQMVVKIFAMMGIALASMTYFIVPNINSENQSTIFSNIKTVFTNKKVMFLCCSAGFLVGPLEGFSDVWGSGFLKNVYGLEAGTANYLPSMIFIGMCFGAPLLSLIAEKTGHYLGSIVGAGILMLIVFSALVAHLLNVWSITAGFIVVGVCCAYQIVAIYKASTYVPAHVSGLTTAVSNMIIMSFGYAFHTVIGFVINFFGGPTNPQSFVYGVSVIPVTLGIGVIGFLILSYQEKKNKK